MDLRWVAVGALLAVGACGGNQDDPSSTYSDPMKCSEVWVVGKPLPREYEGCERADGDFEASASQECVQGGEMIGFQDEFYVTTPGTIKKVSGDMASDPTYRAAFDQCSGD